MVRGQVMVNGSLKPYEFIEYPKWVNGKLIKEAPPEIILKPEPPPEIKPEPNASAGKPDRQVLETLRVKNGNTSPKVNK